MTTCSNCYKILFHAVSVPVGFVIVLTLAFTFSFERCHAFGSASEASLPTHPAIEAVLRLYRTPETGILVTGVAYGIEVSVEGTVIGRRQNDIVATKYLAGDDLRWSVVLTSATVDGKSLDVDQNNPLRTERFLRDSRHIYYMNSEHVQLANTSDRYDRWKEHAHVNEMYGSFLDGHIYFGPSNPVSIPQLLARSDVRVLPEHEAVHGAGAIVVEALSQEGRVTFWCDPVTQLPFRFEVEVNQVANGESHHYRGVADELRWKKYAGGYLAESGSYRIESAAHEGDRIQVETIKARRIKVELDRTPSEEEMFPSGMIPNGARVVVEGSETAGVRYIWREGNAVPYTDERILDAIERQAEVLKVQTDSLLQDSLGDPSALSSVRLSAGPPPHRSDSVTLTYLLWVAVASGVLLLVGGSYVAWRIR